MGNSFGTWEVAFKVQFKMYWWKLMHFLLKTGIFPHKKEISCGSIGIPKSRPLSVQLLNSFQFRSWLIETITFRRSPRLISNYKKVARIKRLWLIFAWLWVYWSICVTTQQKKGHIFVGESVWNGECAGFMLQHEEVNCCHVMVADNLDGFH